MNRLKLQYPRAGEMNNQEFGQNLGFHVFTPRLSALVHCYDGKRWWISTTQSLPAAGRCSAAQGGTLGRN